MSTENTALRQRVRALETVISQQTQETRQDHARLLVDSLMHGIALHQAGMIQFANPALAQLFGYASPAALVGQPVERLIAPHEHARVAGYLTAHLHGQPAPERYEAQGIRQDGTLLWMEWMVSHILWHDVPALLTTCVAITARTQAEEALRTQVVQHQRLAAEQMVLAKIGKIISASSAIADVYAQFADEVRTLVPCDRIAIWLLDLARGSTTTSYVTGMAVTGWEAGAVVSCQNMLVDEVARCRTSRIVEETPDQDSQWDDQQMARAAGLRSLLIVPLIAHDTVLGILSLRSTQLGIYTPQDLTLVEKIGHQIAGAIANAQLLHERQQVEIALRASEAQFRHLIEGSVQGVFVFADDQRPLFVNQTYAAIFGYTTPDEVLQLETLDALIAPQDRARVRHYREARLAGESVPASYEYQGQRRDGTLIWLEHRATRITWQGTPAIQATVVDITKRKQAEEARHHLEDQLRQSQKMQAIGTLAGGIAHEFNNILGSLLGFTDLAQQEVLRGTAVWEYLQQTLTAGRRAKDLVHQILTFSRQGTPERTPLPFHLIIQETLTLLQVTLPSTIALRQEVAQDVGTVVADRIQMHEVVMNLCVNAEQAMRETSGVLTVRLDAVEVEETMAATHPDLQPGSYARLTVHDTGAGIEPDLVERIFEPFFTTKGVGEGTGMGLSIVHGIVHDHGGAILVESTPVHGTTFTLYLPRSDETALVPAETPADVLPAGSGRVLVVDDDPALTQMLHHQLTRCGYEVISSTSSQEALGIFQTAPERFDLVITDQTMPELTGEHLATALRQIRPDIPIILCTGFSHIMDAEKAQALGIDAFLMKPVARQDLAQTIQHVVQQRRAAQAHTGTRILLIDDDDQLRLFLRHMLEAAGYVVVEAADGREGMRLYREAPTDAIITDLLMPEQEGIETIEALRRDAPDVKIIAISGGVRGGTVDVLYLAEQLGAHRVLRKPFEREDLLRALQEVLQYDAQRPMLTS